MKKLFAALLLVAAPVLAIRPSQTFVDGTVDELPATCIPGQLFGIQDGETAYDCSVGNGTYDVTCRCDASGTSFSSVDSTSEVPGENYVIPRFSDTGLGLVSSPFTVDDGGDFTHSTEPLFLSDSTCGASAANMTIPPTLCLAGELEGASASTTSASAPSLVLAGADMDGDTITDERPVFQLLARSEDNIDMCWSCYRDESDGSRHAGAASQTAFLLSKTQNSLTLYRANDVTPTADQTLGWNLNWVSDWDGHFGVGIDNIDPVAGLEVQTSGFRSSGYPVFLQQDHSSTTYDPVLRMMSTSTQTSSDAGAAMIFGYVSTMNRPWIGFQNTAPHPDEDVFVLHNDGELEIPFYDCSGNANGGKLTGDANGIISCADDTGGGGGATDIISEGNSSVEVIDTGSGVINMDIDGSEVFDFSGGTPYVAQFNAPTSNMVVESKCNVSNCYAQHRFTNDAQQWAWRVDNDDAMSLTDITAGGVEAVEIRKGAPVSSLYIDSSGNVGLGRAPTQPLDVYVASDYAIGVIESGSDYSAILQLRQGSTTHGWALRNRDATENFDIYDQTAFTSPFTIENAAPTNSLYIEDDGDVGIGTSSPGYELQVATGSGDSAVVVRLTCVDANCLSLQTFENDARIWGIGTNAADSFQIRDNTGANNVFVLEAGAAANSLYIDSAGEVGIGTSSPSAKLEVNNVLMITPQATAPATCSIGMMYVDTSGAYCACTATNTWSNMTATGTCA